MVKKIKLLFDGQLLAKAFIQEQTGIFRVCDELFKRLAKNSDIELYFLMTNTKGDPEAYLKSRGLDHLVPNIVRMPRLLRTTNHRILYHKFYSWMLRKVLSRSYGNKLKEFDCYFSPYPPISKMVKKVGLKSVCIVHDIIPILYPVFSKCYKLNLTKFRHYVEDVDTDMIFFVSEYTRNDFLRYRYPYPFDKTQVVYLGVDDRFSKKSNKDITCILNKYNIPNKPYLFCLSEANPRKNFSHIIKSFIKYINETKNKDLCLVIGGKKLFSYDYTNDGIVDFEKYKDRIIITGYVEDEDLSALYSGASIFMYPSLYEGFGLPVLEAMKCGAPVITCNNSSLFEVGGDACAYVSGYDVEETANMIKRLLTDETFKKDLIEKQKDRLLLFSWDESVEKMVSSIKKLF
ncbi:glycosyltransferase family 4 protein [bacterium]|nr:glycosyltransferase family 4 protein [bacterium]